MEIKDRNFCTKLEIFLNYFWWKIEENYFKYFMIEFPSHSLLFSALWFFSKRIFQSEGKDFQRPDTEQSLVQEKPWCHPNKYETEFKQLKFFITLILNFLTVGQISNVIGFFWLFLVA